MIVIKPNTYYPGYHVVPDGIPLLNKQASHAWFPICNSRNKIAELQVKFIENVPLAYIDYFGFSAKAIVGSGIREATLEETEAVTY